MYPVSIKLLSYYNSLCIRHITPHMLISIQSNRRFIFYFRTKVTHSPNGYINMCRKYFYHSSLVKKIQEKRKNFPWNSKPISKDIQMFSILNNWNGNIWIVAKCYYFDLEISHKCLWRPHFSVCFPYIISSAVLVVATYI